MPFKVGQRVICEAELGLGVGEVAALIDGGIVDIRFPAVAQDRRYRIKTAPLHRVVLKIGQVAIGRQGERLRIEKVREDQGLLYYSGQGQELCETELEDKIPLGGALDRLRAHNLGVNEELELHIAAWKVRAAMLGSRVRGLCGSRVGLLDHQLYVAQRVSRLTFPRVLLSDQVGLGKTIEAGLIFSALRSLGRADRVLIIVPDSLMHQWLAEMVRRFHELFRVFSKEAVSENNPFLYNSHCLTTWGALKAGLVENACSCDWDLIIIDEAHHLREGQFAHTVATRLAERTNGLLLLTATPARSGLQTEFSLLKLVDPQRYSDYDAFCAQYKNLHEVSNIAKSLHEAGDIYEADKHEQYLNRLLELIPEDRSLSELVAKFRAGEQNAYNSIIEALIDRHGPGRVIFRNRRERLQKLFPGRHIELVPLKLPKNTDPNAKVIDPRLSWIVKFLQENPKEKVVVIASKADIVLALHSQLREGWNINSSVFYEDLTLIERDRQASWFASEEGPKLMICSEIGSEGRNFQFAHNLVFWDVPIQPDIIEQRIGRMDRLGQKSLVNVYVLYMAGTLVELLLRWHMAMGSFSGPVENASEIIAQVDLRNNLHPDKFVAMLAKSQQLLKQYQEQARENVDYLIDLNSYNEEIGAELHREVERIEKSCMLPALVNRILEVFGVSVEETSKNGMYYIHAGNKMQIDFLAGLRDGGMLATYDRSIALEREDVEYLTPDHPLVLSAISALLDSGSGCAVTLRWNGAPHKGLLIQGLYVLEAMGPQTLELYRYMPPLTVLVTIDVSGHLYAGEIADVRNMRPMDPALLNAVLSKIGNKGMDRLIEITATKAKEQTSEYAKQIIESAERQLNEEYTRLQELCKVNDMVSEAEVENILERKEAILKALSEATPRLDGLRIILMGN